MEEQQTRGRAELISTPFREYERKIREQLTDMFGASGLDAKRDIAGIILNRWGHAYASPQFGILFWQGREARLPRDPAQFLIRQNRVREYGPLGRPESRDSHRRR